jgi:uncharacterized protein YjiS (DUF1127 family)
MVTQTLSPAEKLFAARQSFSLRDRIVAMIRQCRRRSASRSELASLTDLDLKDLGYPASAAAEKSKAFWRA